LIAELHAAEIEHRILHRAGDALAAPGFFTLEQRRQNAGDQVDAGARVADLRAGDERHAIDLAGRRGGAAGALRDVLVDLAVLERTRTESLHRGVDHPRIDLLNLLPRKAHPIDRARRVVLDHHVAAFDEFGEDLLTRRGLRVEGDAALVRVQHREVEAVDAGEITKLAARRIAFAGTLDLDDVRPEPGENLRARGSRLH